MRLCLIRHASTAWNEEGRIQGHTDIPLSPLGRAQVAAWRLPPGFEGGPCTTSPLARARETAAGLGFTDADTDARLAEMRWGEFEGRTLADLRQDPSIRMGDLEAMGVDFCAPGGESPRQVAGRLAACLRDLAARGTDRTVIAHKGVLRASLILSLGWDMLGKPPVAYDGEQALIFDVAPDGRISLGEVWQLRAGAV